MKLLLDEHIPHEVENVFVELGHETESVRTHPKLHGQSDAAIFQYALDQRRIIVTRDLGFVDHFRFSTVRPPGLILIRFPAQVSISILAFEIQRAVKAIPTDDFDKLIVLEPGLYRIHTWP